jgi:3-oxoacyl-[acyl-carrier protein] reductase
MRVHDHAARVRSKSRALLAVGTCVQPIRERRCRLTKKRQSRTSNNASHQTDASIRKGKIAPVYWALEMVARIAHDRRLRGLGQWGPIEELMGTIVFIGSIFSQGNKGQIAYAASKAGLERAAATLMKEAIYYGVIHPGFTDTPMVQALGDEFIAKNILPYTQLRRLIRAEEIADAICFLISNSAVSGELWADAGWHPSA